MSIYAATTSGPFPVTTSFRPGGTPSNNMRGTVLNAPLTSAVRFLENASQNHSTVLTSFAQRGFPNGDPSSLSSCRHVYLDIALPQGLQVEGPSSGVACVLSTLAEAIRLLGLLVTDERVSQLGDPFPTIVATGAVSANGQVESVGALDDKIRTYHEWCDHREGEMLFVIPSVQLAGATSGSFAPEHVSNIDDCFALLARYFQRSFERWQQSAGKLLATPTPINWNRAPAQDWRPRDTQHPRAAFDLIARPGSLFLRCRETLRDVFRRGWELCREPLPERQPTGVLFDHVYLRFAAANYVLSILELEEAQGNAFSKHDTPAPPPSSGRFPRLSEYLKTGGADWSEDEWLELVREACGDPAAFKEHAGDALRAIITIAHAAQGRLEAQELASLVQLEVMAATTAAGAETNEALMPLPIRWDLAGIVRLAPLTSASCPILHVWLTQRDDDVDEITIVGRGNGFVRREVEGLVTSLALQSGTRSVDFLGAGLTVIRAGNTGTALDGMSANLTAMRGAFFEASVVSAAQGAAQLRGLRDELRALAARTGLVEMHETTPESTTQALVATAAAERGGGLAQRKLGGAPAAVLRPILAGGRPAAIAVPNFLFGTAAFSELVREYGALVLERVTFYLDRRIRFYTEVVERCRDQKRAWDEKWKRTPEEARDAAKDREPEVFVNTVNDLEKGTQRRIAPQPISARQFYEVNVPSLQSSASLYRARMMALKDGVTRAQATTLPHLAAERFVDAALRGLDAEDVVSECPRGLARAYDEWRRETQQVLAQAVRSWCGRMGLDAEARTRVLTRHVFWRLLGDVKRAVLVPHVLVEAPDSVLIHDGQRGLQWAVHPLDTATNVPSPERSDPANADRVTATVERALAKHAGGHETEAMATLDEALGIDPAAALGALLGRSTEPAGASDDAALDSARRKMAALLVWERRWQYLSRMAGLEAVLCSPTARPGARLPAVLSSEDIPTWAHIPELPLVLAWEYRKCARETHDSQLQKELGAAERTLFALARTWDAGYVDTNAGLADPDEYPPSEALKDAYARKSLSPEERKAYTRWRVRELFGFARTLGSALETLEWTEATVRRLYLRLGDVADRIAEELAEEAGLPEAVRLIRELGAFDTGDDRQ